MAVNDIRIKDCARLSAVPTFEYLRDDRDTSSDTVVAAGEPLKKNATAGQFCIKWVTADITVATDQPIIGVAAQASTETATVDGAVNVYMPLLGVIYAINALTASLANTQSEIDALRGEYDVVSLTAAGGTYSLDTAAGDAATNALIIVGGEPAKSELWVVFRNDATLFGRAQV